MDFLFIIFKLNVIFFCLFYFVLENKRKWDEICHVILVISA